MERRERVAWVLNLDADDELAHGPGYTSPPFMVRRIAQLVPRLAGLVGPHDVVVWPGGASARGLPGRAWCPTPFALRELERAGAQVPRAPAFEVLQKVNHRRFAAGLGGGLPGARYVEDAAGLFAALADEAALSAASRERCWLLRRAYGFAGRERRKVRHGPLTIDDRAWVAATLRRREGLLVEPFVTRELDCALHGFVDEAGAVTLGEPTVQEIDALGAWRGSRLASDGELTPGEVAALREEAARVGAALHAAGYFGPFGIDAFRWIDPGGARHLQSRSEVNARYSMGWSIGMRRFAFFP
jgi:hypothetical protein